MCSDDILNLVVRYTNKCAANFIEQHWGERYANRWKEVDLVEMKAFVGCLGSNMYEYNMLVVWKWGSLAARMELFRGYNLNFL